MKSNKIEYKNSPNYQPVDEALLSQKPKPEPTERERQAINLINKIHQEK